MFASIFFLAFALSHGPEALPVPEILRVVEDVRATVLAAPPANPPAEDEDGARLLTARILTVFAWEESRFRASALGDSGRACGVLQLHEQARAGHSCAAVRADRRLGLRLGLAWMRRMAVQCGSLEAGLRAYASGSCTGARALVARRCALAGGCT